MLFTMAQLTRRQARPRAPGEDLSSLLDLNGTTHTNVGNYLADPWTFAGNASYSASGLFVTKSPGRR
jgi:hypothetical protein